MAHRYRHWTIVQTHQASSLEAAKHIADQKFPTYRPLYRTQANNGVRYVKQLFERYLFVQVDRRKNWSALHSTRGISKLFLVANYPCEVFEDHIEWLRSREDALGYFVVHEEEPPAFEHEQEVAATRGLFEGKQGMYLGLGKSSRDTRRVLFNIMGKPTEFEVKAHDLIAA